jgi:hypothetical protein
MNAMNIPGFTADTSLYKTSGHYQAGRSAINLRAQFIGTIHPAVIIAPGEVIVIEGEAPSGPGLTPGGYTGPGMPIGGGANGGGGGAAGGSMGMGTERPPRPPRRTISAEDRAIGNQWRSDCQREGGSLRNCCVRRENECSAECTTTSNACTTWRAHCRQRGDQCRNPGLFQLEGVL